MYAVSFFSSLLGDRGSGNEVFRGGGVGLEKQNILGFSEEGIELF
ncbi:MAG: hypothetical protein RML72_01630 [Bacteroidia bacterium]|nr:hypothetical protein [Bacteroidia bacterium]MDW8157560.1 hypothetical protein [Bacteroidia bacterium]